MLMEGTYRLEVGDPVYFKNLVIGQVASFDTIESLDGTRTFIAAVLTFNGNHLKRLDRGMKFYLIREHFIWGGRAVEIIEESNGVRYRPLRPGNRVFGEPLGRKQLYEWRIVADSVWRSTRSMRRRLGQRFRESINTWITVQPQSDSTQVAQSTD